MVGGKQWGEGARAMMSAIEAFFLGAMAAGTPSLVILAWLLWRAPTASGEY